MEAMCVRANQIHSSEATMFCMPRVTATLRINQSSAVQVAPAPNSPLARTIRSLRCLNLGGKSEIKTRAARRVVACPQSAAMRLNDRAADRKPHARTIRLGGNESIKDLVRLLPGEPHASIAD